MPVYVVVVVAAATPRQSIAKGVYGAGERERAKYQRIINCAHSQTQNFARRANDSIERSLRSTSVKRHSNLKLFNFVAVAVL